MKRIVATTIICFLLSLLFLTSCSKSKPHIVIGFSQCTGGEWREKMNREMESEIKFYNNSDLIILNAEGNLQKQMEDINDLIERRVDLLIISPLEDSTFVDYFNKTDFKDIPVVLVDRNISSNKHISYVGASNWEIGVMAAKFVHQLRNDRPTRIVHIRGYELSTATFERKVGFESYLSAFPNYTVKTIVSGQDLDGKNLEKTKQVVHQNRELLKTCDVIYGFNDAMTSIAYDELKKTKDVSDKLFIGVDGMIGYGKGVNEVRNGHFQATIVYPTLGEKAIEIGMKIINQVAVPSEVLVPTLLLNKYNVEAYYMANAYLHDQTYRLDILQHKTLKMQKKIEALHLFCYMLVSLILIIICLVLFYYLRFQRNKKNIQISSLLKADSDYQTTMIDNEPQEEIDVQIDTDVFKKKVEEVLAKHYAEYDFEIDVLTKTFNISRVQLYRKFKISFENTPNNYIKSYRLNKAKELLLRHEFNVSEVAYKVGFTSPAYFAKCFKEEFNCTPTNFYEISGDRKAK